MGAKPVTIHRVDYGYPDAEPPRERGWYCLDLRNHPLPSGNPEEPRCFFSDGLRPGGRGVLLRDAGRLLAWSRFKGRGNPIEELLRLTAGRPLVLQCRFPRHAGLLEEAFLREDIPANLLETPRTGEVPPLYRSLADKDPLHRMHLELEWVTAQAASRGGEAFEVLGRLMAEEPGLRAVDLASRMGITGGAVRSYLGWMEEVSLVRREGYRYFLGHPLLARRFSEETASQDRPQPSPGHHAVEVWVD